MFQYPLVDRVGFEGFWLARHLAVLVLFQYPLVDRVGFEGQPHIDQHRLKFLSFSILWWIELVLRGHLLRRPQRRHRKFQYPLVDRVGFEGALMLILLLTPRQFQYPLVDRVGFEGPSALLLPPSQACFSILWWIELVLRGASLLAFVVVVIGFQYPLVDRVGFEGAPCISSARRTVSFSILWWIELVLRVFSRQRGRSPLLCFSILWWIELVLRENHRDAEPVAVTGVSVSSGGSSWF